MKKGFTLAEVLITLAIIGVVAALTIPTVVNNYQKQALYTQFMKMYNTLQTAMQLAMIDHGSPATWDFTLERKDFIDRYIASYVKNQGYNEDYKNSEDIHVKDFTGQDRGTAKQLVTYYSMPDFLILDDGGAISMTAFISSRKRASLFVDVNGVEKGPNTVGRDMFIIRYGYDMENNKPAVGNFDDIEGNEEGCCSISGSCSGVRGETCGMKLLREGKMNY